MRGPPRDLEPEGQRPRVGGDDPAARRLGDDGDVAAVSTAQGRERPEATVLLADDAVERETALERDPRAVEGAGDGEVGGDPRLHVAGPPPVEHAIGDPRRERLSLGPLGEVPGGDDVDVTLEDEAGLALTGPRPDHPVALDPRRLGAGEGRVGAEGLEVEGPEVDLETGLLVPAGHRVLEVGLGGGAGHARDPDQVDERRDELGLVEGVEDALLGRRQVTHRPSVGRWRRAPAAHRARARARGPGPGVEPVECEASPGGWRLS